MTRKLAGPLLALSALALAAPAAGAVEFTHGVQAGDIRSTSAILWARADRRATVRLLVARDARLRRGVRRYRLRARAKNDFTLRRTVRRLRPGRRYWFRFKRGSDRSRKGTFRTAPRRSRGGVIEFAWTGDTDFSPAPGAVRPYWNGGGIFRRMRAEDNDFNVHLGDTIYSDSEVPGVLRPIALSVTRKWRKYQVNLANGPLSALRRSAGLYSHWDDHEFVNDFTRAESSFSNGVVVDAERLYRRGVRAFLDYSPVRYTRRDGIYRRIRWGRNLELFFLDQRSFRSAKASAGGACDNPRTGAPDLAPTGPQSTRDIFGAAVPSSGLSQPVAAACLRRIRDPERSFLGTRQYRRFTRAIERSTARWKVVVNELPIQQFYGLPYDRWEGYEAERRRLLRFLRANVKNVIFLSTDVHATFVNDARLRTLEPGGPRNTGIWDFSVGPAATAAFGLELDEIVGRPGTAALITGFFFRPQPPTGVGMRCAVVDRFSYGQVRVARNSLTVTAKGKDGRQLADCPPLVLRHQP